MLIEFDYDTDPPPGSVVAPRFRQPFLQFGRIFLEFGRIFLQFDRIFLQFGRIFLQFSRTIRLNWKNSLTKSWSNLLLGSTSNFFPNIQKMVRSLGHSIELCFSAKLKIKQHLFIRI